jgi:hypothetical protein
MNRKKARYRPCLECGDLFLVRKGSVRKYCTRCLKQKVVDSVEQLQNKQGHLFDKWRKSIVNALTKRRK